MQKQPVSSLTAGGRVATPSILRESPQDSPRVRCEGPALLTFRFPRAFDLHQPCGSRLFTLSALAKGSRDIKKKPLTNFPFGGFFAEPSVYPVLPFLRFSAG